MSNKCDSVKNTYRDFKEVDIWMDASLSCKKSNETPKKTIKPQQEQSPRASSPIPDIFISENYKAEDTRNAYTAWKDHLHEAPTKMKVRGALFTSDEFISGHLLMRQHEKREYNKENHFMPTLNKCFVNLLINGPSPLVCQLHGNAGARNYLSKCHCLPSCNCERDLAQNFKLPIGYRHNEHGYAVPMVPAVNDVNYRDPMCIYTN